MEVETIILHSVGRMVEARKQKDIPRRATAAHLKSLPAFLSLAVLGPKLSLITSECL